MAALQRVMARKAPDLSVFLRLETNLRSSGCYFPALLNQDQTIFGIGLALW
jgi:hypothetical protein